jgi:hypothetical protein
MAFPFGGHPTLAAYIDWARTEHNFRAQSGYGQDRRGKTHTVTKIYKDGGPSVVVVGIAQNDRLAPSQVGNLDRRLGLNSPWFSVDAGPEMDN